MDISGILEIIGSICFAASMLICLFYGIILIIMAFQESILWGLGYLFVPFVNLIFIIMFWTETKGPFLKGLLGVALLIASAFLAPDLWNRINSD